MNSHYFGHSEQPQPDHSLLPCSVERESGMGLPEFAKDEFEAFLEYGILANGFLRLRWGHLTLMPRPIVLIGSTVAMDFRTTNRGVICVSP